MFLCHSVLPAPTLVGKKKMCFLKKKNNNIAKKRNKHAAKQERY